MEFFGARLTWAPMATITDPENDEILDDANENSNLNSENQPTTSSQNTSSVPPNEIEYAD